MSENKPKEHGIDPRTKKTLELTYPFVSTFFQSLVVISYQVGVHKLELNYTLLEYNPTAVRFSCFSTLDRKIIDLNKILELSILINSILDLILYVFQ